MKQCGGCYRFLCGEVPACPYCGHTGATAADIAAAMDTELQSYRIFAETLDIAGRLYHIGGIIGQGGHGVVLKVRSPEGGALALKVPLEFNEQFTNNQGNRKSTLEMSRKYISHEVGILNTIKNDALVRVHYAGPVTCRGAGKESSFPAILMELARGTLKDIIDGQMARRLYVPPGEKRSIIRQLTLAVEQLHRDGLVHRDLSPHNVFIVERAGEIRYVPADLGTSKPAADKAGTSTRMAFHERYMDPALLLYDNFRYDFRLDIYQLSIIIIELLLEEYWLTEDEETAVYDTPVDFEKEFLLKLAADDVPPAVLSVIRKATTLKIKNRYPSARVFRKDLLAALDREPPAERGPREPGHLRRNLGISFSRVLPPEEDEAGEHPVIIYRGRRRLSMGGAVAMTIEFQGIRLTDARVAGPSYLRCRRENNRVLLEIDGAAIREDTAPLFAPPPRLIAAIRSLSRRVGRKKTAPTPGARIAFDAKAVLHIEGEYLGNGPGPEGEG